MCRKRVNWDKVSRLGATGVSIGLSVKMLDAMSKFCGGGGWNVMWRPEIEAAKEAFANAGNGAIHSSLPIISEVGVVLTTYALGRLTLPILFKAVKGVAEEVSKPKKQPVLLLTDGSPQVQISTRVSYPFINVTKPIQSKVEVAISKDKADR